MKDRGESSVKSLKKAAEWRKAGRKVKIEPVGLIGIADGKGDTY